MKESILTTIDNPYNPFEEYELWYDWDFRAGYHTPSFLARIVVTSDALSETDQNLAIEEAINEIVKENVSGVYTKVTREVPDPDKVP